MLVDLGVGDRQEAVDRLPGDIGRVGGLDLPVDETDELLGERVGLTSVTEF